MANTTRERTFKRLRHQAGMRLSSQWPSLEFIGEVHGTTCGKRYRFRDDCEECAVEAAERQALGVQVQQ